MRWSYKTVHYELKKEGLLGSSFLDESEVELSLNEYGRAGWELVSLMETMNGIIAVFKQPVYSDTSPLFQVDSVEGGQSTVLQEKNSGFTEEKGGEVSEGEKTGLPVLDEFEVVAIDFEEEKKEEQESSYTEKDVGAIRIE